jgi:hypothetical protein
MPAEIALPSARDIGIRSSKGPDQTPSSNLEFRRMTHREPLTIKTGLTSEHLRQIFEWETSIWSEGKPYEDTLAQFTQEQGEATEIWKKVLEGEAGLEEPGTIHDLRAEIGDGIIAGIGMLRSIYERDDERVQATLTKALNQPESTRKRTSVEARVSAYSLKGQGLISMLEGLRDEGLGPNSWSGTQRNDVVLAIGSVMKAGFEALRKLGVEPGRVIEDKIGINRIKYSQEAVAATGSMEAAKQRWKNNNLAVVHLDNDGRVTDRGMVLQKAA